MSTSLARELGLEPPFSSSPTRNPNFNVRVLRDGELVGITNFYAMYAAKKFIDQLTDDVDYKWVDETSIKFANIVIHCEQLEDLVEHEYTKKEAQWELPLNYLNDAEMLVTGRHPVLSTPYVDGGKTVDDDTPTRKSRKTKREKAPKKPAQAKKRVSHDNMTTIAEIASQLDMTPGECRAILRKTKTPKPDAGWAWSKADVPSIKKLLSSK